MKNIILGIIIGIAISLGSISFAQTQIKLIMVPEYINNYKTLDLLKYMAEQKAKTEEVKKEPVKSQKKLPEIKKRAPAPIVA